MKASTLSLKKHKPTPIPKKKENPSAIAKRIAHEQKTARVLRKENRKKALQWLFNSFPAVFNLDAPKPLAIGIDTVIVKHEIRKSCAQSNLILRKALNEYVSRTKYLECLVAHNRRYDIDGNSCGVVTAEQKTTASERLKRHTRQIKTPRSINENN